MVRFVVSVFSICSTFNNHLVASLCFVLFFHFRVLEWEATSVEVPRRQNRFWRSKGLLIITVTKDRMVWLTISPC